MALLTRRWTLALIGVVVVVIGVGGYAAYRWNAQVAAGATPGATTRQDACASVRPDVGADWIPVTDSSAAGMQRLLVSLPMFTRDPGEALTPGTAVLTHPFHMHTGSDFNDCPHWLLPERDATGHVAAMVDYVYDYPHARIRFASMGMIPPSDPRYGEVFPYLSARQAAARLKAAKGVDAKANPAPELVFLPLNVGTPEQPGPGANWRGGGIWPSDPIWLIAGADGQDYFIGKDSRVYTLGDMPLL